MSCSFTLSPSSGVYALTVKFLGQEGEYLSEKSFDFFQKVAPCEGENFDLFSLNGHTHERKTKFIKGLSPDINGIDAAKRKLQLSTPTGPVLLVLDLKGHSSGYLDEKIERCEEHLCNLLRERTDEKIQSIFEGVHLDYVLCEGSLKRDLLEKFDAREVEFLQSKAGVTQFCLFAEYFINGFKFGHEVEGFSTDKYIKMISAQKPFMPKTTNIVWYPPLYKDQHAEDGPFQTSVQQFFQATRSFDNETQITTINYGILPSGKL